MEYRTKEQVARHLARVLDADLKFRVLEFDGIWVCQPVLTPQERADGAGLGAMNVAVDPETGVVLEYPSWPAEMVAEDYQEALRTGQPPSGGQLYPPLWTVNIQRTQDNLERVEYLVHARSLAEPPEPEIRQHLVIDKTTPEFQPTDTLSAIVAAWVRRHSSDEGWPEHGTLEY